MTPFVKYLLTWTLGCLIGGGFVFAIAKPALDHGLAAVTQLSDQIQDIYSQATVLCEPNISHFQSEPGIPAPARLAELFQMIAQPPVQEQGCAARWYIPMKVHAIVYGDPKSTQVWYFNVKTKSWDGPHDPETIRK